MISNDPLMDKWRAYVWACRDRHELEQQLIRMSKLLLTVGGPHLREICTIISNRLTQLNQENLGESRVELRQAPSERTA